MHDGLRAYPAAVEALRQLRRAGKRSVVLSNAPRRAAVIAKRNAEIGIPEDLPDHLLSSGEDAWQHLKTRPDAWYRALGTRCYHLGRSEEHTSELQSLMRISYAVFCLKKKTHNKNNNRLQH